MRDAIEILKEYNKLLEEKDLTKALDLISEMKQTDPSFVEVMMKSFYDII